MDQMNVLIEMHKVNCGNNIDFSWFQNWVQPCGKSWIMKKQINLFVPRVKSQSMSLHTDFRVIEMLPGELIKCCLELKTDKYGRDAGWKMSFGEGKGQPGVFLLVLSAPAALPCQLSSAQRLCQQKCQRWWGQKLNCSGWVEIASWPGSMVDHRKEALSHYWFIDAEKAK